MRRSHPAVIIFLALFILAFSPCAGSAAIRTALVIGNSAYRHTEPLKNPKEDATAMAATLRRLGFHVFEGVDLTKAEMDELIKNFASALETSEAGLFYYAGHGLQVNDRNFLVPVDAELKSPAALEFEMVRLDQIQAIMERLTPTNVLIMDACRNNPLARNLAKAMGTRSIAIGSGFAPSESGAGTLIAYATQPGSVALDGEGEHSPFSAALLKYIDARGDDLSSILINVRNDVMKTTFGRQVPWEHSALSQRFYFIPPTETAAAAPSRSVTPSDNTDSRLELELWDSVKDSRDVQMLKSYLDRFPAGTFAGVAHLKIAELERKTVSLEQGTASPLEQGTASVAPPQKQPAADLPERLQKELKRVGCYDGAVDGDWGEASEAALKNFAAHRGGALASSEPDEANLEAVLAQKARICPLQCGAGTVERNGTCVAKAPSNDGKAAAQKRDSRRQRSVDREPREKVRPRQKPPEKKDQICLDNRNLFVDCNEGGVVLRR